MEGNNNLSDIIKQIKEVESGVNDMIVPMLKDTIRDGNRNNNKLFSICIIELIIILVIGIFSLFLVYRQNQEYKDFLSQFEFESEVYQDIDTDNNSDATINDGINITK